MYQDIGPKKSNSICCKSFPFFVAGFSPVLKVFDFTFYTQIQRSQFYRVIIFRILSLPCPSKPLTYNT